MSQFYITDSKSLSTVREAVHHRMPITISGMVGKGVRYFTGVVQSVEEDKLAMTVKIAARATSEAAQ